VGLTEAVLAIDAGNSKTDVCVVAADGAVLGSARGGPFRPHLVGAGQAVDAITPAVADALSRAGSVSVGHVAACLANADLPAELDALEAAIARTGWAPSCEVVNDTFALLRVGLDTGLDSGRGVAVVCGAGINCTGVLADGTTVRFAAVGHISGDWGGGGHLWREAMWWAARAEDGRGPDTALRTALPSHFGLASMSELIEAVHLRELTETRCLELTPLLFEVAEQGDPVAVDLVRRQAEEVVALAATAIRRLGVADEPIDVVLGGGVLTARHPLLMDAIARLLAEQAPMAIARVVEAPPIVGAALLGLDRLAAPTGAHERLREAFRTSRPMVAD
jgi:N-acetylglucosamine kinase-like BadF-type ATPase